jgi:hypothetical protein
MWRSITRAVSPRKRRVAGYQDLLAEAPLDLVCLADHTRIRMVRAASVSRTPRLRRAPSARTYTFMRAHGLAAVIRAWIAIAEALGLTPDQEVLFSQTVGYPRR